MFVTNAWRQLASCWRWFHAGKGRWLGLVSGFLGLLCLIFGDVDLWPPRPVAAISPAPPSPVIAHLAWAPASSIQRAAAGSDNWPLTWADDGHLYTAYGDGRGFQQAASQKLSLGFARVAGGPTDFVGTNIPSPAEQLGDGRHGKKASGLLMVEGVLYMWVRNANNDGEQCQLARSTDYAQNWTWSDWTFAQFGYCTFINYGQNYAGARDAYVYMVSHNHPSAYTGTNDFILTRVPKDKIFERAEYEFFMQLDGNDQPVWSSDIDQRGAVFSYSDDRARRSGITYNAALGRYLWWHGFPHGGDEKDSGGFGIYDAPEPWGPWTTVYYTDAWDVGPGETASFPTKWMSADGTELYLVFSGDDAFSVRKATLTLAAPPTSSPTPTERTGVLTATPTPTNAATSPLSTPTATATATSTATAMPTTTATATDAPSTPAPNQSIQVRVASGDDDVEEQDGDMNLTSGDLEMVENNDRPQVVGIRFADVIIPPGAAITRAVIQFTADDSESKETSLLFHGAASDDAIAFTDVDNDLTDRVRTGASVVWSDVPAWSGGAVIESPNLAPIVQEIVNRDGWQSGNALVFIVSGSGKRAAVSYNGDADDAPRLLVAFTTGDAATATPTLSSTPTSTPINTPTSTVASATATPTPTSTSTAIASTATATSTPTAASTATSTPTAPTGSQTIQVRVVDGDDDVEEQDGDMNLTSGDLEMVENNDRPQVVGIRFADVAIPSGAAITRAVIQFTADDSESKETSLLFHGAASDDAIAFTDVDNDLTDRVRTGASVAWSDVPAWSGGAVIESPNLAPIVQEIVNRDGWQSGNALVFIVSGSGKRAAVSYNGDADDAPRLLVAFSAGGLNSVTVDERLGTQRMTTIYLPTAMR